MFILTQQLLILLMMVNMYIVKVKIIQLLTKYVRLVVLSVQIK